MFEKISRNLVSSDTGGDLNRPSVLRSVLRTLKAPSTLIKLITRKRTKKKKKTLNRVFRYVLGILTLEASSDWTPLTLTSSYSVWFLVTVVYDNSLIEKTISRITVPVRDIPKTAYGFSFSNRTYNSVDNAQYEHSARTTGKTYAAAVRSSTWFRDISADSEECTRGAGTNVALPFCRSVSIDP